MSNSTAVNDIDALRTEVLALRDAGKGNIRVHPNAFIQIDLAPTEDGWHASHKQGHSGASRRLHIWNPPGLTLPHQETINEIHDHVFDMKSEVVRGVLCQQLYWFVIGAQGRDTHELYRAIYNKGADSRLESTGIKGQLKLASSDVIGAGESYTQPAFTLHDSNAGENLVVTVMTKTKIHEGDATVICRADTPPDNDFDRATAADPEVLWRAVERSLS